MITRHCNRGAALEIKSTQARQHSAPATCCTYGRVNLNRSTRHHDGDAALEIKCCRSVGLATPPPASSLRLVRSTKLPALTGKSMSNLRGSLRQSRPPSGARTAPPATGQYPVRTTAPRQPIHNASQRKLERRRPRRATARHERRGPRRRDLGLEVIMRGTKWSCSRSSYQAREIERRRRCRAPSRHLRRRSRRKKKSAAEPSQLRREPCRECDDSNGRKQGSYRGRYLAHDSDHDSDAPVRNSCFTRYLAAQNFEHATYVILALA